MTQSKSGATLEYGGSFFWATWLFRCASKVCGFGCGAVGSIAGDPVVGCRVELSNPTGAKLLSMFPA